MVARDRDALEVLVGTQLRHLVAASADEGKAGEVAAVRCEEDDLEVVDATLLLQATPELDALLKDAQALRLSAPDGRAPTDEQAGFRHLISSRGGLDPATVSDPEHRDQALLVLGVDPGDDLDVLLQARAAQLLGEQLVDLEDAGAVGHLDLDAHRLLAAGEILTSSIA